MKDRDKEREGLWLKSGRNYVRNVKDRFKEREGPGLGT